MKILSLSAAFCSNTIFRKSHKSTLINLSRFQMYVEKSYAGIINPPSWVLKGYVQMEKKITEKRMNKSRKESEGRRGHVDPDTFKTVVLA